MPNRRNTRRNNRRSGGGLLGKLYGPVSKGIKLGDNVISAVTNTTRNVARRGLGGVNRIGKSITGRTDEAISGLLKRRGGRRGSRKGSRKGRKGSRRNSRRN